MINIYLTLDKETEAQHLIEEVERRLEDIFEEPYTFKLLNELANTTRRFNNLQTSIQIYKKALLSIKTRFKNNYMEQPDTSKILINIASTEYMKDNLQEALRYYDHALNVLSNCGPKHTN